MLLTKKVNSEVHFPVPESICSMLASQGGWTFCKMDKLLQSDHSPLTLFTPNEAVSELLQVIAVAYEGQDPIWRVYRLPRTGGFDIGIYAIPLIRGLLVTATSWIVMMLSVGMKLKNCSTTTPLLLPPATEKISKLVLTICDSTLMVNTLWLADVAKLSLKYNCKTPGAKISVKVIYKSPVLGLVLDFSILIMFALHGGKLVLIVIPLHTGVDDVCPKVTLPLGAEKIDLSNSQSLVVVLKLVRRIRGALSIQKPDCI
jgi:hypothetical protein